jgi:hypothetical protein
MLVAYMLPAIVLAWCLIFQVVKTPDAPTPADAPLPSKGKITPKAVDSELAGSVKEDGVMSFARYEGGGFALKPNKVTTYVNRSEIVLIQGKQRFAIPVKDVAEIVDGNRASARVSQDSGNPIASTAKTGNPTVVGIVWSSSAKKDGVVLRLDKGDYAAFVSALESVTGLKTIDTDR